LKARTLNNQLFTLLSARFSVRVQVRFERSRFGRTVAVRSNVRGSVERSRFGFAIRGRGSRAGPPFAVRGSRCAGRRPSSPFGFRFAFALRSSKFAAQNSQLEVQFRSPLGYFIDRGEGSAAHLCGDLGWCRLPGSEP